MKVELEAKDKYGQWCMVFHNASMSKIYDYLFLNFPGYKFLVVMDTTGDYQGWDNKDVYVYFMDCLLDEMLVYCDLRRCELKEERITENWDMREKYKGFTIEQSSTTGHLMITNEDGKLVLDISKGAKYPPDLLNKEELKELLIKLMEENPETFKM